MNITRDQAYERRNRIPEPILNLGYDNVIVAHTIDRYVSGEIVTLEEFQWQLIRGLATDWHRMQKAYIDYVAMTAQPMVLPCRPST